MATGLYRLVLLLVSVAFIAALVVAGLTVLLATVLWSLLRGRKPAVFQVYSQFRDMSSRFRGTGSGVASSPAPNSPVDVVDVEAREVDGTNKLR